MISEQFTLEMKRNEVIHKDPSKFSFWKYLTKSWIIEKSYQIELKKLPGGMPELILSVHKQSGTQEECRNHQGVNKTIEK